MINTKKIIFGILIVILLVAAGFGLWHVASTGMLSQQMESDERSESATSTNEKPEQSSENSQEPAEKEGLIRLTNPRPEATVTSPLVVRGEAVGTWYFEGSFGVSLVSENDEVLARAPASAKGSWMTEDYVPFEAVLDFETNATSATLVLSKANPSGLAENADQLTLPVRLADAGAEKTVVEVFFSNTNFEEGASQNCQLVASTARKAPETQAVGRLALTELLSGPTDTESDRGFITQIPEGTELLGLRIDEGTAYADFSSELSGAAGSCRVRAIRSQIERTLDQFSSVDDIVISIEGETEGVLQP